MTQENRALLVRIRGRVQGVSFRVWARDEARRLGVTGWIRNEPDGSVLARLAGPDDAVSRMIKLLWEGPRGARVSAVDTEPADLSEASSEFRITG